jgi:hypothetical protein
MVRDDSGTLPHALSLTKTPRVPVRGEKQAILVASGGMLGRDDVEKASDGDFYIINHELTSIEPTVSKS